GLKGNWVKCFAQNTTNGMVYVGTSDAGIFTVSKNSNFPFEVSFRPIKIKNGSGPVDIAALTFSENKLWYVEDNGHYGFIQNDELTDFYEDGRSFRNIVCENNVVWMGSKDDGILCLTLNNDTISTKKWIVADSESLLQSNNIYQLLFYNNQLWVGT